MDVARRPCPARFPPDHLDAPATLQALIADADAMIARSRALLDRARRPRVVWPDASPPTPGSHEAD